MRYRLIAPLRSDTETVSAELSRLLTHARSLTISTVMVGPPYKPMAYQAWVLDVPDALVELVSTRVLPLILSSDTGFQEIAPIPHRGEWTRRALLVPTPTAQPLTDIGHWSWASASLHLHWAPGRCGGLLLYSNEDVAHLQTLADKGWKVSNVPAIAARVINWPLKHGSYSGPPWIGQAGQSTVAEASTPDPVIAPLLEAPQGGVAPGSSKPVASETNVLAEPGTPGLLLGATLEGQGVTLAWRALELALDGPLKRQREAVLALTGRGFAQGMGVLAVLPRPMVADGVLTPWSSRLRMLDGRDLWSSAAIPWQSIERDALQNALPPIGLSRALPDTLPEEFGTLLHHIGLRDLATQGVLGLTARPGDDLAGVLSAGGGVVLLDSGDEESDLLGNLLMAACLPAAGVDRPLLVIRPARLALPEALAERAIQLVLGSSASALATLRAQNESWCLISTDDTPDMLLSEDLNTEPSDLDENIHTSLVTTLNGPAAEVPAFQADTEEDWYLGTPTDLRALEPVVALDAENSVEEPQATTLAFAAEAGVSANEITDPSIADQAFLNETNTAGDDWMVAPQPTADNEDWSSLTSELDSALQTDENRADEALVNGATPDNMIDPVSTWSSDEPTLEDELSWPSQIDASTVDDGLSDTRMILGDDHSVEEVGQALETPSTDSDDLEFTPLDEWNVALDDSTDHILEEGTESLLDFEDGNLAQDEIEGVSQDETSVVLLVNRMEPDESLLQAIGAIGGDEGEWSVDEQGGENVVGDLTGNDNSDQIGLPAEAETYDQAAPAHDDILVLESSMAPEEDIVTASAATTATFEAPDPAEGIEVGPDTRLSLSFAEQRSGMDRRSVVRDRDRRRRRAPIIRYRGPAPANVATDDVTEQEAARTETMLETSGLMTAGVHVEKEVLDTVETASGADVSLIDPNGFLVTDSTVTLPAEHESLGVEDSVPDLESLDNNGNGARIRVGDDLDVPMQDAVADEDASSGEEVRLHDVVLAVEPIWQAWRGGMSIPTIVRVIHEEQPHLNRGDIRVMVRELIDRLILERLDPAVIAAVTTATSIESGIPQAAPEANQEPTEIEAAASTTPVPSDLVGVDAPAAVVLDGDDHSSSNTVKGRASELDVSEVELSPLSDLDDLSIDLSLGEEASAHAPSLADDNGFTPLPLDADSGSLMEDVHTLQEFQGLPIPAINPDVASADVSDGEKASSSTGLTPTSSDDDIWAAWRADADITAMVVDMCGFSRGLQATTTKERIYQVVTPRIVDELNAWPLVDRLVANKPALKSQTDLYETLLRRMNRQQYNVGGFNHKKTHERLVRLMRAELAQRVP